LKDNNGAIELDEFLTMMATRMKANEKIKEVFKVFDRNADG
jgi:Ca2+-binding EF-hand superfamily protein